MVRRVELGRQSQMRDGPQHRRRPALRWLARRAGDQAVAVDELTAQCRDSVAELIPSAQDCRKVGHVDCCVLEQLNQSLRRYCCAAARRFQKVGGVQGAQQPVQAEGRRAGAADPEQKIHGGGKRYRPGGIVGACALGSGQCLQIGRRSRGHLAQPSGNGMGGR